MEMDEDEDVLFQGSPLYNCLIETPSLAEEFREEAVPVAEISKSPKIPSLDSRMDVTEKRNVGASVTGGSSAGGMSWWKKLKSIIAPEFTPQMNPQQSAELLRKLCRCSTLEEDDSYFLYFLILASLPKAVPPSIWDLNRWWQNPEFRKELDIINDFIDANSSLVTVCKKSLRLVQEMELISRGFTLVSQRNPLSLIENTSSLSRQCPGLRQYMFTVNREAVLFFREMTLAVFNLYPVRNALDIKGSYLAYEPLKSYGTCIQAGSPEEWFKVTDGFSMSALKGVFHLFSLHQSEFVKSLALVYHQDKCLKGAEMHDLLRTAEGMLKKWTSSLQQSVDFHSSSFLHEEHDKHEPKVLTQSPGENVRIAVHSLDLHLQAALSRARALTKLLEDVQSEEALKSHGLVNMLQPIKSELDSCKGCWEEAQLRMEQLQGTKTEKKMEKIDEPEMEIKTSGEAKPVEDYIIEDQVFEAYTDPNEKIGNYDWEKPLTEEEKEKKRQEKQEAMRVLTELKSVISVRAVEINKREEAALRKMYPDLHKPFSEHCPEDEKGDEKNEVDKTKNEKTLDTCKADSKTIDAAKSRASGKPHSRISDKQMPKASTKPVSKKNAAFKPEARDKQKSNATVDSKPRHFRVAETESQTKEGSKLNPSSGNKPEADRNIQISDTTLPQENEHQDTDTHSVRDDSGLTASCLKPPENCKHLEESDSFVNDRLELKDVSGDIHSDKRNEENTVKETNKCDEKGDISKRQCKSYVTAVGVRRLRKSNILELKSESDEEENGMDYYYNGDDDDVADGGSDNNDRFQRFGLPLFEVTGKTKETVEASDENRDNLEEVGDLENDAEVLKRFGLPPLSLEDKLQRFGSTGFGFTPALATEAVEKSKMFGEMEEETFGGDVYGEMSEEDDDQKSENGTDGIENSERVMENVSSETTGVENDEGKLGYGTDGTGNSEREIGNVSSKTSEVENTDSKNGNDER